MRLSNFRVPAALVLAASLAGTATTPVFAYEVVVESTHNYTATCGYVTCSIYFTKDHTKRIRDTLNRFATSNAINIGAPTAACAAISVMVPPAILPCSAIALVSGGIGIYMANLHDWVNKAADQDLCIKFRNAKTGGVPWFSADSSSFCR